MTSQLERRSELKRPDARGQLKSVAANVDLIAIVVAPEPEPYANLIDRYLVAAHMASIDTLIILNKSDLLDQHPQCLALLESYRAIGYQVMTTGPTSKETQALSELLGSRTSVFVGQSGVGKSSIINRLLPDEELRVGALSEGVLKGRHTTTTAEVFERPNGGFIIDSPGIREFGLQHIDPRWWHLASSSSGLFLITVDSEIAVTSLKRTAQCSPQSKTMTFVQSAMRASLISSEASTRQAINE